MQYSFNRFQDTASPAKNLEYERENSAEGSKNRIKNFFYLCPLLFLVTALLFTIVMLHYDSHIDNYNFSDAHDALNTMSGNLNQKFIQDIKTAKSADSCPTGYKHENVGKFYGTDSGCLCADGSVHTRGYCWFKSDNECKYSSDAPSRPYKHFFNTKICAKHMENVQLQSTHNTCPPSYPKKCPDLVCVKDGADCQVTGVNVAEGAAGDGEIALGTAHKMTLEKAVDGHSVVGFHSEVSNTPCSAINNKRPHTASKKAYPLDEVKNSGCGKYGDLKTMSKKLGSESLESFYKHNGLAGVTKALPFFSNYHDEKDQMNLYSISRVTVPNTKECHKFDSKAVGNFSNALDHVLDSIRVIGILIIVFAAIGILLTLLFLILRHRLAFLNKKVVLYAIYALAAIVAILCIILFSIYIHNKSKEKLGHEKSKFEELNSHKCFSGNPGFQSAANDMVQSSQKLNSNVDYIVKTLFAAAIIFLVGALVAMGIRKAKKMAPLPDPRA